MVGRAQAQHVPGSIGSQSGYIGGGAIPIGNIAVYPDINSEWYIKKGFSANATLYTVINFAARRFAYLPRYVYQITDEVKARQYKAFIKQMTVDRSSVRAMMKLQLKAYDQNVVTNAYSQLLIRPNPMDGQDSFFELTGTYYMASGEAFIWLNRGTDRDDLPLIDGPILEMWNLPPQYVEIVPDPLNVWGCLGYVFNVAGKRIPIDEENIIHWKKPNPNFDGVTREHMRGLSPLRPGKKIIAQDEAAADASVAMHQNNGARAIVFDKSGKKMTPEQETTIRSVIDRKVNYKEMKGAVAYVQGDLGVVDLAMSSVDMDLETSKDNIFDRACNLLSVPPHLFRTNATYENVIQARKDFIVNLMLPMACSLRDEMDRVLLPAFGLSKTYTQDIDSSNIPELQDDMLKIVQALALAYWLTPNEKRVEQGQEKSEDPNMDKVWVPNTVVLMDDAAMPQSNPADFDPENNSDELLNGNNGDSGKGNSNSFGK